MLKKLLCLAAVAAVFPLTGCGGYTCEDACDDGADGGCITDVGACKSACEKAQKVVDASNCTSEYDDLLSCGGDNSDKVCDSNDTSCSSEANAYTACIMPYCTANPTACQ